MIGLYLNLIIMLVARTAIYLTGLHFIWTNSSTHANILILAFIAMNIAKLSIKNQVTNINNTVN